MTKQLATADRPHSCCQCALCALYQSHHDVRRGQYPLPVRYQSHARALFSYATPNNHILHSALVWAVTNIAGSSPVAVRFVALSSALLATALMFRVASRFASFRAGVAAAALMLTTLTFADYAVNARGYTLSVALTLLLIDRLFLTRSIYTQPLSLQPAAHQFRPDSSPAVDDYADCRRLRLDSLALPTQRRYLQLLPPLIFGVMLASVFYLPSFLHGDVFTQDITLFGESDLLVLLRLWLDQTFGTPGIGLLFAASCIVGMVVLLTRYPRARVMIVTVIGITVLIAIAQMLVLHKGLLRPQLPLPDRARRPACRDRLQSRRQPLHPPADRRCAGFQRHSAQIARQELH